MKTMLGLAVVMSAGLFLVGCGSGLPSTVATSGKLLWEDGTPIGGATVRFEPVDANAGRLASGFSGKDGAFSMSTFSGGDGAMVGDYVIVVTKVVAADETSEVKASPDDPKAMANAMKKYKETHTVKKKVADPIPAAYGSAKSSSLKWRVAGPKTDIEIKLKRG